MYDAQVMFIRQLGFVGNSIAIILLVTYVFGIAIGLIINIVLLTGIILYNRRNQSITLRSLTSISKRAYDDGPANNGGKVNYNA